MWTRETQTQTRPVQIFESDTRDDFAQQHVLHCLQELGQRRQEVMFVLSQLNFSDYLNKPAYSAAAAQLPLPADLPKDHRRGDFDIVLIHRHHGILIGEIKAIGLKDAELNKQESEADAVVAKRVERSIKQLDKSEKMVKHLVQDIAAGVSVKKTLILPYVTNTQLQRVLSANPQLEQALSQCLGVPVGTSPLQMCLCAEQLSHRATAWYLSSTSLCELEAWWQGRMACDNDSVMSDDVYLNLIARFCGPATTVSVHCVVTPRLEVRTLWEAVSEVGERIARLVLTPEQQDLLHRLPDLVCLSGPPGTGKSVGLVLVGLQWLRQGVDVHVVSTNHARLAASLLIFHQLKLTLRSDAVAASLKVTVVFHDFDFLNDENGVELAVNDLVAAARGQRLCVLMDESTFTDGRMATLYQTFVDGLYARVSRLSLWAGAVRHANIPARLQVEPLTVPLRSAPAIVREIERGTVRAQGHVHDYSSSGTPSPCDGPSVIRLRHEGVGHVGSWPVECFQCGQDVGGALRQLHVGVTDDSTHSNAPQAKKAKTSQEARPPPLQYRDVVVLTRSSGLHDDVKDKDGHVTVPASGVVLGLRSAGIPVHVIRTDDSKQWRQDVADIAVARTDQVTVSWYGAVFGLERKIVVCLPGRWRGVDHQRSAESVDALDRIFAVSRCTAQLIFVDVPRDNAGDNPHVPRGNVYDHPVPRENANDYAVPKGNTDAPPVPKVNADDHPVPRENADTPPVPKVNDDDRPVPRENAEDRPVPKDSESLAHDKKDIANVKDDAGSLGTMSRDSKNERGVLNSVMCTKHADLWPVLFKLSEL